MNELITKLPHVDVDKLEGDLAALGATEADVPDGAVVPDALRDEPLFVCAHATLLMVKQFLRTEYGLSESRIQARARGGCERVCGHSS